MLKAPAFQVEGEVIRIINCRPRGVSMALILIASALTILPFVRALLPADVWFAFDEGEGGPLLYLFGVFACLMAAFWWSVVTIDRETGEVEILRRWGLFRSRRRQALDAVEAVVVKEDSDRDVSVYLEGSGSRSVLEWNHDQAIVWGRSFEESREIARTIAKHLQLRLTLHGDLKYRI
jgi:hypothetical protein